MKMRGISFHFAKIKEKFDNFWEIRGNMQYASLA